MTLDRFRAPTRADDLQTCAGCGRKLLPEAIDAEGLCYEQCSEFESEEDEEKALKP
jgi:hypothetical protein